MIAKLIFKTNPHVKLNEFLPNKKLWLAATLNAYNRTEKKLEIEKETERVWKLKNPI